PAAIVDAMSSLRSHLGRIARGKGNAAHVLQTIAGVIDPVLAQEWRGERVFFHGLRARGILDGFEGKRILEIGPKHGQDSMLLASLRPSELVLIDLPSKDALNRSWLGSVEREVPTRFVQANLLYLTPGEVTELGHFDLVWCT